MTSNDTAPSVAGTASDDYASGYYGDYYNAAHNSDVADYSWESPHWRNFFSMVADRIVGIARPRRTLDVGCAKGMLVQALADKGVDAWGYDISEFAIESSHPDVRDRLQVRSATEPIEGRFDLITCIEVLEHLAPEDAQKAMDAICAATDRVLFSSSPADFEEPTHINTRPTSQWAAWFAERGFYRKADVDATWLTWWAVMFERSDPSPRELAQRYEGYLQPLNHELIEKRRALLDTQRRLSEARGEARPAHPVELTDKSILERHAALISRDSMMGLEAEVGRLTRSLNDARRRLRRLRNRLEDSEAEVKALRSSRTWRVGQAIVRPLKGR